MLRIKLVLATLYCLGLVAVSTWVPWVAGTSVSWGYAWFWAAPNTVCRLDIVRLTVEFVGWSAALSCIYFAICLYSCLRQKFAQEKLAQEACLAQHLLQPRL